VDLGFIGGRPGQDGADITVYQTNTVNMTPATYPFTQALGKADLFLNTTDGISWAYTGLQWVVIGRLSRPVVVTTSNVAGVAPVANAPANPASGDVFINETDRTTWIHNGAKWEPVVDGTSRGTVTYVGSGPYNTANIAAPRWGMAANTQPDPSTLEPEPGDVYIDMQTPAVWVLS
jgi:hypothetical protein